MIQPSADIKPTAPAVAVGFDASSTRRKTIDARPLKVTALPSHGSEYIVEAAIAV
jgi:hypothetical protein